MKPLIRIAIYKTSSLGDVIISTACLDFLDKVSISLKQPFEVTWIGRSTFKNLFNRSFKDLVFVEADTDVRASFDLVVDLQANLRSRRVCRTLAGGKAGAVLQTWRSRSFDRSFLVLKSRIGPRRQVEGGNQSPFGMKYSDFVGTLEEGLRHWLPKEELGLLAKISRPKIDFSPEGEKAKKEGLLRLAVGPGAAFDTKRAPPPVFTEILRELIQRRLQAGKPVPVLVFIGLGRELDLCRQIYDRLPEGIKAEWPTAKDMDVFDTAAVLAGCDVFLGNDSAPGHLAEALGIPVACLFGPTVEKFGFSPFRPESQAFSSPLSCRPCSKHGKSPCRYGDKLCFQKISRSEVVNFLDRRLSGELS